MPKQQTRQTEIMDSVHNIWLAGLGSLRVAEEEGSRLFNTLVEKGREIEHRLDKPVEKASDAVKGTVRGLRRRAGTTMRSVESAIDDRVTSVLGRLGVPTREEITMLTRRVEELTKKIPGLKTAKRKNTKPAGKTARPRGGKKPARKTAGRKSKSKSKRKVR